MAKVKSEATRNIILDAASQVFQLNGYESSTMDAIRDVAQVSKATLYSHFASKAELFIETLLREAEANFNDEMLKLEQNPDNLKNHLTILASNMIRSAYSTNGLAIRRLLIADGRQNNLGKKFYERGPQGAKAFMTSILQKAMNDGYLKQADAEIAECHFRALVEAEFVDILYFGLDIPLTEEWIKAASERAIETFFKIYK
ncbi:MAG: TetR/AcrR family transcriptional regulator [Acinetobacter calcoaceticus]|uniref:TetR/AcrR family transcriptional regulator n=1 Tax=Acinetobacter calcoaceticus TaxID=471 RepID=UPI001E36B0D8|nr:TetR/AcrR family transcriptional regulator [Acinetobacter calcoaceticus]UGQ25482.1 TetR/AcrR family transcriptional regulator [Acinetobacter calcoaceticus]